MAGFVQLHVLVGVMRRNAGIALRRHAEARGYADATMVESLVKALGDISLAEAMAFIDKETKRDGDEGVRRD